MIHPPQVRPEEPIAVTPHDGIYGGESQQWLSYPTNPHVRFDEREWETELRRMAHATAPIPESTVSRGDLEPQLVAVQAHQTPIKQPGDEWVLRLADRCCAACID